MLNPSISVPEGLKVHITDAVACCRCRRIVKLDYTRPTSAIWPWKVSRGQSWPAS